MSHAARAFSPSASAGDRQQLEEGAAAEQIKVVGVTGVVVGESVAGGRSQPAIVVRAPRSWPRRGAWRRPRSNHAVVPLDEGLDEEDGNEQPPRGQNADPAEDGRQDERGERSQSPLAESKVGAPEGGMGRAARFQSRAVFVSRGTRHAVIMSDGALGVGLGFDPGSDPGSDPSLVTSRTRSRQRETTMNSLCNYVTLQILYCHGPISIRGTTATEIVDPLTTGLHPRRRRAAADHPRAGRLAPREPRYRGRAYRLLHSRGWRWGTAAAAPGCAPTPSHSHPLCVRDRGGRRSRSRYRKPRSRSAPVNRCSTSRPSMPTRTSTVNRRAALAHRLRHGRVRGRRHSRRRGHCHERALDAIERVLREHTRAGDRVIVEDPRCRPSSI